MILVNGPARGYLFVTADELEKVIDYQKAIAFLLASILSGLFAKELSLNDRIYPLPFDVEQLPAIRYPDR
jgi:hypothetical protein